MRATVLAAKGNMGMHFDTPLVSLYFYSSLAQSVEHLTVNQGVAGSSPAGGATQKATQKGGFLRGSLIKGVNVQVCGSKL